MLACEFECRCVNAANKWRGVRKYRNGREKRAGREKENDRHAERERERVRLTCTYREITVERLGVQWCP